MIRVKFRCILLPKLQFNLEVIKYSSMEKYNRPRRSLWAYSKDWIQIQEYDPNPGFSFYEDGRRPSFTASEVGLNTQVEHCFPKAQFLHADSDLQSGKLSGGTSATQLGHLWSCEWGRLPSKVA